VLKFISTFRELGSGISGIVMKAKKIYNLEDNLKPYCLLVYLLKDSAAFYCPCRRPQVGITYTTLQYFIRKGGMGGSCRSKVSTELFRRHFVCILNHLSNICSNFAADPKVDVPL
jgi:hypothetical protein